MSSDKNLAELRSRLDFLRFAIQNSDLKLSKCDHFLRLQAHHCAEQGGCRSAVGSVRRESCGRQRTRLHSQVIELASCNMLAFGAWALKRALRCRFVALDCLLSEQLDHVCVSGFGRRAESPGPSAQLRRRRGRIQRLQRREFVSLLFVALTCDSGCSGFC